MRAAFVIPGPGATQGSMTFIGNGRVIHPAKLTAWRALAMPIVRANTRTTLTVPVEVKVVALFTRPASHYGTGRNSGVVKDRYRDTYPPLDVDKLARAVNDVLQQAGFLANDSQVWHNDSFKFYTDQAAETHIEVTW